MMHLGRDLQISAKKKTMFAVPPATKSRRKRLDEDETCLCGDYCSSFELTVVDGCRANNIN